MKEFSVVVEVVTEVIAEVSVVDVMEVVFLVGFLNFGLAVVQNKRDSETRLVLFEDVTVGVRLYSTVVDVVEDDLVVVETLVVVVVVEVVVIVLVEIVDFFFFSETDKG